MTSARPSASSSALMRCRPRLRRRARRRELLGARRVLVIFEEDILDSVGEPEGVEDVSAFGEQFQVPRVALNSLGEPTVVWESFDVTYFCEDTTTRIQISRGLTVEPQPGFGPSPSPEPSPEASGTLRLGTRATARSRSVRLGISCVGGCQRLRRAGEFDGPHAGHSPARVTSNNSWESSSCSSSSEVAGSSTDPVHRLI